MVSQLTITSHVSVVKNFLATDEIAGRDVIIWIIYIGIMIHRFRVEWSIGLDLYTTRCKGEARVGFSWRVKHRFAYRVSCLSVAVANLLPNQKVPSKGSVFLFGTDRNVLPIIIRPCTYHPPHYMYLFDKLLTSDALLVDE